MTPAEKAIETRRKHKEAREKKALVTKSIQEKMTSACCQILDDPSVPATDKLKAVEILHILSEKRWRS